MARNLAVLVLGSAALFAGTPCVAHADGPEELKVLAKDPNTPEAIREREFNKARATREKEMKKIRYKYFRATNNNKVRQEGMLQLRGYTDPACFKSLIDVFQDQGEDVQRYILDIFSDAKSDEGDATLTWCAIFGKQDEFRSRAIDRLARRCREAKTISDRVKLLTFQTLRTHNDEAICNAAQLALTLGMYDAIPHLITAQVGRTAAPADTRVGDMAWISVGQQVAFVSDLTPVVSQNSAAFDPQLSVATDGSLLRIQDAAVSFVYRGPVNSALQGLGSALTGQNLKPLGYDIGAWREWYRTSYLPAKAALDAKQQELKNSETQTPARPSGG